MNTIAWTGGTRPYPLSEISESECKLVGELYRAQLAEFYDFWGAAPDTDTCRIFWERARYDAHATMRSKENE